MTLDVMYLILKGKRLMENIIGAILTIVGIPSLIYIFWQVREMNKESKKRREELRKLYSDRDESTSGGEQDD